MKRACSFAVLLAFFSGYGVPNASANVCVTAPLKQRQACGTVLDFEGQPIPNATVVLSHEGVKSRMPTDAAGRFTFRNVANGPAEFEVNATGFSGMRFTLKRIASLSSRCTKPLWVMLDLGMDSCPVVASRFKDLPLRKRGLPIQ
jgi:hypothetical protein